MDFLDNTYPVEPIQVDPDKGYRFRFESVGVEVITKIVIIEKQFENDNIYNLGFGNLIDEDDTSLVDDTALNVNNDATKILNTVFKCVLIFLYKHPENRILFFGNTEAKNKMYKRKIAQNLPQLKQYFEILAGLIELELKFKEHKIEVPYGSNGKKRRKVLKHKDFENMKIDLSKVRTVKFSPDNIDLYKFVLIKIKNTDLNFS